MAHPTKKGEKFKVQGEVYTVKCFFGHSGHEYNTLKEARKDPRNNKMILIKNVEYDGTSTLEISVKI